MPEIESHIFKAFESSAQQLSAKTALTFRQHHQNQHLTYQQLLQSSRQMGRFLTSQGLTSGDRVALLLDNQPEFVIAFLAIMSVDAVAVPIDSQFEVRQIERILSQSAARLLLTSERHQERIGPQLSSPTSKFVIDGLAFQRTLAAVPDTGRPTTTPAGGETLAVLFYTSGTTEDPKAVMLSHRNLLSNYHAICQLNFVHPEDVIVSVLPLHHAYAFTTTLLLPLLRGATVIFPAGLTSQELASSMRDTQATLLAGVPQLFALIDRSICHRMDALPALPRILAKTTARICGGIRRHTGINFGKVIFRPIHQAFGGRLRYLVSGGAKLDPAVARSLHRWGFTVLEGYGLTETAPVAAFNAPGQNVLGSVGRPIPGVEIRILDPDEQGIGEVAIKGPNVMLGYYQRPDETKAVLQEGWFKSGDLGYLDARGYLFLSGRKKELIVLSNGKNIVPDDLEKYYGQNPFIKEIAVLAAQGGSFLSGTDQLVAIIVIDEEYFRARNETNIRERLKWELDNMTTPLPSYKRIRGFVISQEPLPRTRLGKIQRYRLAAEYQRLSDPQHAAKPSGREGESGASDFNALSQTALNFLTDSLKRDLQLTDHLELDLGLDSLGRIELLLNLQERLGLELSDEQAMDFFMSATIGDLLTELRKIVPEDAPVVTEDKPLAWGEIVRESPQPASLKDITLSFGPFGILFNIVVITFFKIMFRVFFLLRVRGQGHLPQEGPYLICPNHTSYLDGLFVLAALPYRVALQTYFVGLSQFFRNFLLRPFIRLARLIPMEMTFNITEALKVSAYVLRQKKIVCYFPEGQRSIDGEVKEFKKGVGVLSKELQIPVVPVYLQGAFSTWPRKWRFPRLARVTVHIGEVLSPEILSAAGSDYEHISQEIRASVDKIKQHCCNI